MAFLQVNYTNQRKGSVTFDENKIISFERYTKFVPSHESLLSRLENGDVTKHLENEGVRELKVKLSHGIEYTFAQDEMSTSAWNCLVYQLTQLIASKHYEKP